MLVSNNNNEAALAKANRPPDAKIHSHRYHRAQMTPVDDHDVDEKIKAKQYGLVVGSKHPLVHELAAMLRPKRSAISSIVDDIAFSI
ncbi:unnamed protein product [Peronospora belbahrii]|uniref:Uncharacterized protein n=1 Tax=Peronospora belbahrii TaxID=622444 RepID=A0ABN8D5E1_9STRA|nr:unnamed protein product [Peronospora belbahrii]